MTVERYNGTPLWRDDVGQPSGDRIVVTAGDLAKMGLDGAVVMAADGSMVGLLEEVDVGPGGDFILWGMVLCAIRPPGETLTRRGLVIGRRRAVTPSRR